MTLPLSDQQSARRIAELEQRLADTEQANRVARDLLAQMTAERDAAIRAHAEEQAIAVQFQQERDALALACSELQKRDNWSADCGMKARWVGPEMCFLAPDKALVARDTRMRREGAVAALRKLATELREHTHDVAASMGLGWNAAIAWVDDTIQEIERGEAHLLTDRLAQKHGMPQESVAKRRGRLRENLGIQERGEVGA